MQEPKLPRRRADGLLDPKTSVRSDLLSDIASELGLPVLLNIHNVSQARQFAQRIVGLRSHDHRHARRPDEEALTGSTRHGRHRRRGRLTPRPPPPPPAVAEDRSA